MRQASTRSTSEADQEGGETVPMPTSVSPPSKVLPSATMCPLQNNSKGRIESNCPEEAHHKIQQEQENTSTAYDSNQPALPPASYCRSDLGSRGTRLKTFDSPQSRDVSNSPDKRNPSDAPSHKAEPSERDVGSSFTGGPPATSDPPVVDLTAGYSLTISPHSLAFGNQSSTNPAQTLDFVQKTEHTTGEIQISTLGLPSASDFMSLLLSLIPSHTANLSQERLLSALDAPFHYTRSSRIADCKTGEPDLQILSTPIINPRASNNTALILEAGRAKEASRTTAHSQNKLKNTDQSTRTSRRPLLDPQQGIWTIAIVPPRFPELSQAGHQSIVRENSLETEMLNRIGSPLQKTQIDKGETRPLSNLFVNSLPARTENTSTCSKGAEEEIAVPLTADQEIGRMATQSRSKQIYRPTPRVLRLAPPSCIPESSKESRQEPGKKRSRTTSNMQSGRSRWVDADDAEESIPLPGTLLVEEPFTGGFRPQSEEETTRPNTDTNQLPPALLTVLKQDPNDPTGSAFQEKSKKARMIKCLDNTPLQTGLCTTDLTSFPSGSSTPCPSQIPAKNAVTCFTPDDFIDDRPSIENPRSLSLEGEPPCPTPHT
ncbi:hypothetical protein R1flu_010301 [Riccia fluitans]|uniref:Uncharacterized protein n=1 Tax=Riccia fluitans TaxID=41844 RepID=A0ABD1Z5P8_9MARC